MFVRFCVVELFSCSLAIRWFIWFCIYAEIELDDTINTQYVAVVNNRVYRLLVFMNFKGKKQQDGGKWMEFFPLLEQMRLTVKKTDGVMWGDKIE